MRMSESIKELTGALIAVQSELPTIIKDKLVRGDKFSYRYVGLDTVMPEALAILNKHGMALTQTVGMAEAGGTTLTTMLLHDSGQWLSDAQPLLLAKADPQGQGSAITYARRYGLMAMLGIVAEEDDDANRTVAAPAKRRTATRQKPQGKPLPPSTADAYENKARELEQSATAEPAKKPQPNAKEQVDTAVLGVKRQSVRDLLKALVAEGATVDMIVGRMESLVPGCTTDNKVRYGDLDDDACELLLKELTMGSLQPPEQPELSGQAAEQSEEA